jgi:hypothetical protein
VREFFERLFSGAGDIASGLLGLFYDPATGNINYKNVLSALGAYGLLRSKDSSTLGDFFGTNTPDPRGYQGAIPKYDFKRELLPNAFAQSYTMPATEEGGLPTVIPRRPGSGGRYYFTQGSYQPTVPTVPTTANEDNQNNDNQSNDGPSGTASDLPMDNQARNQAYINRVFGTLGTGVGNSPEREDYTEGFPSLAGGGLASLSRGYYLGGPTDGMADLVPATIDGTQPAALSDGEFVIPADVVSHLGNGNSDAGAQQLYSMMDRVRRERTGTTRQGPEINPTRMMPA